MLLDASEGFSVDGAASVFGDGFLVGFGRVSLVPVEPVDGELFVVFRHDSVPVNLGHHGGGRYGNAEGIPLDDGLLRYVGRDGEFSVDEQVLGLDTQVFHGDCHGKQGCLQDVDAVDFFGGHDADPDCDRFFEDQVVKMISFLWGEFFGVGEPGFWKVFGKNDCGGNHRSRQRPASGFVYSRNARISSGERLFLEGPGTEIGLEIPEHGGFVFFFKGARGGVRAKRGGKAPESAPKIEPKAKRIFFP